ncbi:MAG: hypothetical protein ACRDQ5_03960, partial [Sciscionella sp.]
MTSRPAPTRGALRALRGGLLALCSGALAVAAHALAGGAGPDTGLTLLLTALVGLAGVALADRRRCGLAILGALGVSHLGAHLILTTLAHHQHAMHVDGALMTAAHVSAVLLTAVLLTRAEAAVFASAAALAMLLPRRPLSRPVPPATPATYVASTAVDHVRD